MMNVSKLDFSHGLEQTPKEADRRGRRRVWTGIKKSFVDTTVQAFLKSWHRLALICVDHHGVHQNVQYS